MAQRRLRAGEVAELGARLLQVAAGADARAVDQLLPLLRVGCRHRRERLHQRLRVIELQVIGGGGDGLDVELALELLPSAWRRARPTALRSSGSGAASSAAITAWSAAAKPAMIWSMATGWARRLPAGLAAT